LTQSNAVAKLELQDGHLRLEFDCLVRAENALVFQDRMTQNPNFVQRIAILAFDGPASMTEVGILFSTRQDHVVKENRLEKLDCGTDPRILGRV
jgi:hypothetical protein